MNANLPLYESTLAHGMPPAPRLGLEKQPAQPRPRRILLADDDRGIREILGRLLAAEHYQVIFARTGHAAVERFIADPPDLVLLDLNMPDQDGWVAFRAMNRASPMLPVIVITARPNQYAQATELGVDAFMEKPLDPARLLAAIKDLIEETDTERMLRLVNPEFQTVFLNHDPRRSSTGTSG